MFLQFAFGNLDHMWPYFVCRNGLTKYTVIKMNGVFHKTLAIREAVNSIQDQNSIVFLTDLHLDTPSTLFESVRKVRIYIDLGQIQEAD